MKESLRGPLFHSQVPEENQLFLSHSWKMFESYLHHECLAILFTTPMISRQL